MSIERRLEKLEGKARPETHCTACDPGPKAITIAYRADDPDPRIPPGDLADTIPLKECPECGRRSRVFG